MTWETYVLDVTISNYKNKGVSGELDFGQLDLPIALQTTINDTTCDSTNATGNKINLPFDIKPNDNYQCQLTVTLEWA
jgi:hypothetical protein